MFMDSLYGSHFSGHMAVFLGLLSLAAGYWVCLQARTDTACGKWGKFLGIFISVVAAAGLVCIAYLTLKGCCGMRDAAWEQKHIEMMEKRMPEKALPRGE